MCQTKERYGWSVILTHYINILGVIDEQENLWTETVADDPAIEADILQGGKIATDIDPMLYHDLQVIISRLVGKANQLIDNVTTNLAESWMHIRTKFDGGKVVNRSQSGSWEHRCMGAGLQQNKGKEWGPSLWKEMTHTSPTKVFTDTANRSAKKAKYEKTRKAKDEVKRQRQRRKYSHKNNDTPQARRAYNRHDGGLSPDDIADDISPEHLDELKKSYYETKVTVTPERADEIEQSTREQDDSPEWIGERRKRLTASVVGGIAKMRETTSRSKRVESILYTTFRGNAATRYGATMEDTVRQEYQTYQRQNGHPNLKVDNCGLFVSLCNPWLAATPDGVVDDPSEPQRLGLIEIKNPYTARNQTLMEAAQKSAFCLEQNKNDSSFRLKRRHDYFYQVQTQLYCTARHWCDFTVQTSKDFHIERIYVDKAWQESNLPKLKKFYFSALLPELACPRHHKGGIREPS